MRSNLLKLAVCLYSVALCLGNSTPARAQRLDSAIEAIRLDISFFHLDHAKAVPYEENLDGQPFGVTVDLRRPSVALPVAVSLYYDYAIFSSDLVDSAFRVRAMHAYGAQLRLYLPSSLKARLQPYVGAGIGSYHTTDNVTDPNFHNDGGLTVTRQGRKYLAGVETSYHVFVEAAYTKTGMSTLNNSTLSIGIRL